MQFPNMIEMNVDMQQATAASEKTTNCTIATTTITTITNINDEEFPYCPLRFDGYLCWPRTPAGTISTQRCPDFIDGFNSKFLAHKICLENGSWYRHPVSGLEWSNYTNCIDYEDLNFRKFVNDLYVKGYSISFAALLLSLFIFWSLKSLRCTRIHIHIHLFASLACTCLTWILWYKLVVEQPTIIQNNSLWCIGLHLIAHYFMLVNYLWMFCEGLHLHLVLVVVFIKDAIAMRWFIILSWLTPLTAVISYGIARYVRKVDNKHCWMDYSPLLWIFSVPICLSLMAGFFFLINILRVVLHKLHPQAAQPLPIAIRKALRATIILVPLFGLQHFLLPYQPELGTRWEHIYQLMSVALISLQGMVVAILFCFANHDVIDAIRIYCHHLLPELLRPTLLASNTGQLPTNHNPSSQSGC